jgi:hypothetical protein
MYQQEARAHSNSVQIGVLTTFRGILPRKSSEIAIATQELQQEDMKYSKPPPLLLLLMMMTMMTTMACLCLNGHAKLIVTILHHTI